MRKVSSKFASRRFFGKNILENRREYLVTGQKTVGSSTKSKRSVWEVRDPSSDRDDAVVYKEKVYGYKIPRHKTGGKHWHDITLRRFGKVGKDGDLVIRRGRVVPSIDFNKIYKAIDKGISYKDYVKVTDAMSVTLTPNWTYAKIRYRKKKDYTKISDYLVSRNFRNTRFLQRMIPNRKLDVSVTVGFLHPNEIHNGASSRIPYAVLIPALMLNGYDPLLPIRDPKYISKMRDLMGREIGSLLNKRRIGMPSIRGVLYRYGREIEGYCYEYIMGGIKPPLSSATISKRKSLKNSNPSLYKNGIEQPLVETGNLANALELAVRQDFFTSDDNEDTESVVKPIDAKKKKATERSTRKDPIGDVHEITEDEYRKIHSEISNRFFNLFGRFPKDEDEFMRIAKSLGYQFLEG